jgi:hypothetical protein
VLVSRSSALVASGSMRQASGVACVPCRSHRIRAAAVELAAAFLHRKPAVVAAVALLCRAHAIVAAAVVVLRHCHALLLVQRCAFAHGPQAFGPGLSAHWGHCWCCPCARPITRDQGGGAALLLRCGGGGVRSQCCTCSLGTVVVSTVRTHVQHWGLGNPRASRQAVTRCCCCCCGGIRRGSETSRAMCHAYIDSMSCAYARRWAIAQQQRPRQGAQLAPLARCGDCTQSQL